MCVQRSTHSRRQRQRKRERERETCAQTNDDDDGVMIHGDKFVRLSCVFRKQTRRNVPNSTISLVDLNVQIDSWNVVRIGRSTLIHFKHKFGHFLVIYMQFHLFCQNFPPNRSHLQTNDVALVVTSSSALRSRDPTCDLLYHIHV